MGMAPNPFGGAMGVQPAAHNPFGQMNQSAFGATPAPIHQQATSPFGQNPFGQPTNNMATLNAQVQQLNMNQPIQTNPFGQPAQNNMMSNMVGNKTQ